MIDAALLDDAQRRAVEWPASAGHLLVVGAPGSGKTTTALTAFLQRAAQDAPDAEPRHLLLAPTRVGAGALREVATQELLRTQRGRRSAAVHTPAAFAFGIVRQFAVAQGKPAPSLITGAQQDQILAELLEGHAEGFGGVLPWPEGLPREVMGIPAFRDELRSLFMRADEFGLESGEVAELGRAHGRPEWVLAGALLEEYRNVVALGDAPERRGERYDAARVLAEAATLIEGWESFSNAPAPVVDTLVVDDYQEASAAFVRLLHALADRGTQLLLLADPDVAVQTFRGARPQFVGRATGSGDLGGFGASRLVLPVVQRGTPDMRALAQACAERVPTAGVVEHRTATLPPESQSTGLAERRRTDGARDVAAAVLPSPAAEGAYIAQELRAAHLYGGVPWNEMAVVVRSARAQREIAHVLRELQVPVTPTDPAILLRDEPAVRMLFSAITGVLGEDADGLVDHQVIVDLLLSDVGAVDDVSIRRLRREALRRIRAGEGFDDGASIDAALAELCGSRAAAASLPGDLADAAGRVAHVLEAVRAALAGPHPSPQAVLWAAWDATGLAENWRRRALAGGPLGERASSDLDALIALFKRAENYELGTAHAGVGQFIEHVNSQSIPTDSVARTGIRRSGVDVLTVAQAAGREWNVVVVAGLQEGTWPDTRIRDSLLGAGELADLQLGRLGLSSGAARAEVLGDEWRLLTAAVTRARHRVLATAVLDDDWQPSGFFQLVASHCDGAVAAQPEVVRRLDLRGLVAELRATLDGPETDTHAGAADVLAVLARLGVDGAHPAQWAGTGTATTMAELNPPGQPVYVSPSRVESAVTCPLRWALESTGGRQASRIEQSVGMLVHEIAEEMPHGTEPELLAALDERFDSLGLEDGFAKDRTRLVAERMIGRLAQYVASVPGEVETEVRVRQGVGDAVISGLVDRVEHVDGGVRIADLKTGGSAVSAREAQEHPQLATYQLAFNEAALHTDAPPATGARLVYVGGTTQTPSLRNQDALEPDGGWAREMLDAAVATMRGSDFGATTNKHCRTCPVRTSCPAQSTGRRIEE